MKIPRFKVPSLAIAALLMLCAGSVHAANDGDVLKMPESVWLGVTDNLPHADFSSARSSFINHQPSEAAAALRRASAYLQAEAYRAKGARADVREALSASASEIGGLADHIEAGTLRAMGPMDHTFARAYTALANSFLAIAEEAAEKDPAQRVGHYLRLAVHDLDAAALWSGHEVAAGEIETLKLARKTGKSLERASDWGGVEEANLFERLHDAVAAMKQRGGEK